MNTKRYILSFSALSQKSRPGNEEDDYTWLLYTLMAVPAFVTIMFIFVKEQYARSDATSNIGIPFISSNNFTTDAEHDV